MEKQNLKNIYLTLSQQILTFSKDINSAYSKNELLRDMYEKKLEVSSKIITILTNENETMKNVNEILCQRLRDINYVHCEIGNIFKQMPQGKSKAESKEEELFVYKEAFRDIDRRLKNIENM
jgi:hypothetical protein